MRSQIVEKLVAILLNFGQHIKVNHISAGQDCVFVMREKNTQGDIV